MDRPSGQQRTSVQGDPTERAVDGQLVSRSREIGDVSFGTILHGTTETCVQWTTPDGVEIVAWGEQVRLTGSGPARFQTVRDHAAKLFSDLDHDGPEVARPRAFGGFSFHDEHEPRGAWQGFGAATFVIPDVTITRTDAGTWLTATDRTARAAADQLEHWYEELSAGPAMRASGTGPGIEATERTTTREEWIHGVEAAIERIEDGRLEKVVLAQALEVTLETPIDVPATLERLRRRYRNCYRVLFRDGDSGTFFGAPPERLVRKRGTSIRTEALAGSVPRGGSPETDEELAAELRESPKVNHEHGVVVDAIVNQLEPLTTSVTTHDQRVKRLATIQHLWTPIEATLDDGQHVLDIVEALHPTPAVGGIPPDVAWETIRAIETFDRGWYAAPIGWFDANGDGEFAVGIRSGVARDDRVTLFAGNGIVADSDPADEWDEVLLKYRPILDELRANR